MSQLLAIQLPWRGEAELAPALAALVALNVAYARHGGWRIPPLYGGAIRYALEGRNHHGQRRERWLCAPEVARYGYGDCEDLACYRAMELRLLGEDAMAIARPTPIGWHIQVRRGDGTIEDPSARLGMPT
jgi:hypothetical protein